MRGKIRSYLEEKGYGFISGDDGRDYFFHRNGFASERDRAEIQDELSVNFNGLPTPKGYRAENIKFEIEPLNLNYKVPEYVEVSKEMRVRGWEILEKCAWRFVVCSRNSIDDTREELCRRAADFGANALVDYHYSKRTGSEPGTGKGTHHYTIHEVSALPVNVAKRSIEGTLVRSDFVGLDERIKIYLKNKKLWQKRLSIATFATTFITIAVLSETLLWPAIIACVASAIVYSSTRCDWIQAI